MPGDSPGRFRTCRAFPGEIPDMPSSARTLGCEMSASRTYQIRTYGCQMNMHDSERLAGLLEDAGYQRAPSGEPADVVVFNTCAVRENADNRLYGNLGHLLPVKQSRPGMRSPWAAAWPRRTVPESPSGHPGSTSRSVLTTSARSPPCSNGSGAGNTHRG